MTRRSLRINAGIAAGALVVGAAFTVVLHLAGMPPVLIAVSAVLVGSAAVLVGGPASRKTRVFDRARAEDEARAAGTRGVAG